MLCFQQRHTHTHTHSIASASKTMTNNCVSVWYVNHMHIVYVYVCSGMELNNSTPSRYRVYRSAVSYIYALSHLYQRVYKWTVLFTVTRRLLDIDESLYVS